VPTAKPTSSVINKSIISLVLDECFGDQAANDRVYDQSCKDIVLSALEGINGTIFMYGQTGAGKTYTMLGDYSKALLETASIATSRRTQG